jgi:hypothetical protein
MPDNAVLRINDFDVTEGALDAVAFRDSYALAGLEFHDVAGPIRARSGRSAVAAKSMALLILISGISTLSQSAMGYQTSPGSDRLSGGVIYGRVYCADTQRVARSATVLAVPLLRSKSGKESLDLSNLESDRATTDLAGGFSVRVSHPGTYLVAAELDGYISGLMENVLDIDREANPAPNQELERDAQVIRIDSGASARVNLQLQRGAALTGTVTYDDGSPAANVAVDAERVEASAGLLEHAVSSPSKNVTDDVGRFRIFGLPSGKYIVGARLSAMGSIGAPASDRSSRAGDDQTVEDDLTVFSAESFHQDKGTVYDLASGEERQGADIIIPVDSLARVSGVVATATGETVSGGFVDLNDVVDKSMARHATIGRDGTFVFTGIPPGSFCFGASGIPAASPSDSGKKDRRLTGKLCIPNLQGSTSEITIVVQQEPEHWDRY